VGHLTLVDHDVVDLTNLQRQIAHTTSRVGRAKTESAAQAMAGINPHVQVTAITARAGAAELDALVTQAGVVLDCSDNFATRQAVNAACVAHARPLVSAAAVRFDAQVSVHDPRDARCPCYACMFPLHPPPEEAQCATLGVFAPVVGIAGTMQAAEAIKLLTGIGRPLTGRLLMLDAREMAFTEMRGARDPACPVCAQRGG